MKLLIILTMATVVMALPNYSLKKRARQDVAPTVTLVNQATPSVIDKNTPELVPTVIDAVPTTTVKPLNVTTTAAPEEEDSSEEEDTDDEDNDDNEDENEEEDNSRQILIPGYLTPQGELLVPIDTVQRGLRYTVIEDPYADRQLEGVSAGGVGGGEVETVREINPEIKSVVMEPKQGEEEEDDNGRQFYYNFY